MFLALQPTSVLLGQSEPETADDVSKLVKDLKSGKLETKRDAAYALAKLGSKAQPALKTLIEVLDDERDSQVWVQVSMTVARIGPAAKDAIPVLIEHLGNRDEQRRYRAAFALGRIGPAAIPELKKTLESRSSNVRASAASALSRMGTHASEAIPELIRALADSDTQVRENAADALQTTGTTAQQPLLVAAKNANPGQQAAAIRVLGQIGSYTDEIRTTLETALDSDEATVRAAAFGSLFAGGLDSKKKVTVLRRALTDTEQAVRSVGLLELRRGNRAVADIQPLLNELLESERPEIVRTAATGIGILGADGAPSIPTLIGLMQKQSDDDPTMVRAIVRVGPAAVPHLLSVDELPDSNGLVETTLAKFGPRATEALVAAMDDDNENVRLRAIRSLGRMEGLSVETFESIVARLQDSDARIREAAAQSIGQAAQLERNNDAFLALSKATNDSVPAVRSAAVISMSAAAAKGVRQTLLGKAVKEALSDSDARVRRGAMAAIARAPQIAHQFVDQLIDGLQDDQPQVRADAATAMANLDSDKLKEAKSIDVVAAALVNALNDESPLVKTQAAIAVGRTKAVSKETVPAMSKLLTDSDPSIVGTAIQALGELGSESKSAVPQLLKLNSHPNATIRAAIATALPDIDSDPKLVVAPLLTLLTDADWSVRREAAHALGDIGSPAADAVPALFKMLEVEDDTDFARGALRKIDDANANAVPILIEGLKSGDRRRVYYAVFLLTKVGSDARDALPHLETAKKESDSDRLRGMIDRAIKSIGE